MLSLVFPKVRSSYSLLRSDLLRFLPIRKDAGRTAGFIILLICLCLELITLLVFLTLTEHLLLLTTSN
jgi:hypothetical protein